MTSASGPQVTSHLARFGTDHHFATAPNGWPGVGVVSPCRTGIMGREGYAMLFGGSNGYFDQYARQDAQAVATGWAELTTRRHETLGRSCPMVTLFVPNKATCMPDCYPTLLPTTATPIFMKLGALLAPDPSVLFSNCLTEMSRPEQRREQSPWRFADTRWTDHGAAQTCNEILEAFGLPTIEIHRTQIAARRLVADLGDRWPGLPIQEFTTVSAHADLPTPTLTFDPGSPLSVTSVTGYRVGWENPDAPIDATLLVVGNSFCATGVEPEQLTWWLARVFRSVSFIWSPAIPTDALKRFKPDYLLFQTVERFLPSIPQDTLTVDQSDRRFVTANSPTTARAPHG